MVHETHFRRVLPALQTALAISFGGWGLWQRNAILNRPFWGSTGWHSTAVFHVWPWPLKFATILNLPALIVAAILSWPIGRFGPAVPKWLSYVPVLLVIPFFWYWFGSLLDKRVNSGNFRNSERWWWAAALLFTVVSAAASLVSTYVGSYSSHVVFGAAIWLVVAIGLKASATSRKRESGGP